MRRPALPAWFSISLCLAVINFLSNTAMELTNVYLALYARSVGSTNLQVGYIAAIFGITFFVSSLIFGRLSDIHGRMKFIRIGLCLTSIAFFTQALAQDPWTLFAIRGFVGFSMGINSAAIMAYTYDQHKGIGSFISYGALGWLAGAMLAALVKGYTALFILSSAFALFAFLVSFLLTEDKESAARIKVAAFPIHLIRSNYKIFLAFFLRSLGGIAIWTIWPLYLNGIGATRFWISVLDSTNMLGQFFAMRYVEKFNPARVFQLGLAGSVIVFALYGTATHYAQVIPIQLLLSVGYSALFIGALNYLLKRHRERGTVAGLLNSSMSLSGSIGPFFGGSISQTWGYGAVMYTGAALSFLGLLASWGLKNPKAEETAVSKK